MSGSAQPSPAKANIYEITMPATGEPQKAPNGKSVLVHFNPQTLKVSYSNENKSASQPSGSASQFVGAGTSKLAVELLFDTSTTGGDVRQVTADVAYFIKPAPSKSNAQGAQPKRVPPGCRFEWGTFRFDGVVDSLQETLDYFSEAGVPLRSTLSLGLSGIDTMLPLPPASGAPGTAQTTSAPANASFPQMAGANGNSANWQPVAAANNVDDPLHLPTGASYDLSAGAGVGGGIGAGASIGASAGFSAGIGAGVGFSAGASVGTSASIGLGVSAGIGGGIGGGFGASAGISAGAGISTSGGIGIGASTGVGASAGISVTTISTKVSTPIAARANAAGALGGSFGRSSAAGASARIQLG